MNDKWLRIIGIPIVAFFATLVYKSEVLGGPTLDIAIGYGTSLIFTTIIWHGNRYIWLKLQEYYPGFKNNNKRIIRQVLTSLTYTISVNFLLLFLTSPDFMEKSNAMFPQLPWYFNCSWFSILMVAFFMTLYESRYFLQEWKKNIQQTEALAHAHLQSQFEALKKQLDPHFLFNSLNTLASLIDIDNQPAQAFLERLSDVYRYVLETRNKSTVSIEEELTFLDAYIYLLKERFRDNLSIENDLSEAIYHKHVPALSLQILVENAIKHNVISKDRPLNIRISEAENFVQVENNKQIKHTLSISTGIGLQNIIDRYQLLNKSTVEVIDDPKSFRVKLPLLNPSLS
ncbi:MAG: histidine kinase [Bacteroidota bacterium]